MDSCWTAEELLRKNWDLIANKDFETFYSDTSDFQQRTPRPECGKATKMLLDCGINPLNYLKKVPFCFLEYSDIEEFEIPEGIEEIDEYAFLRSNIRKIKIPKSILNIHAHAFKGCYNLVDVIAPKGLGGLLSYFPNKDVNITYYS